VYSNFLILVVYFAIFVVLLAKQNPYLIEIFNSNKELNKKVGKQFAIYSVEWSLFDIL